MTHSPAYILTQYLIGEGLLTAPDGSGNWKVYVGSLPDGNEVAHNIVGCMDTSPVKDGRMMGGGETLFHFGVQLLIRSSIYNSGYAKALALEAILEAVDGEMVEIDSISYSIKNVSPTTGVVIMGQEEGTKRRWMFSMNFLATLKEE